MLPFYAAGLSGAGGAAAAGGLFDGMGAGLLSGGLSLGGSMMGASSSSKSMSKQLKWMSAMARKRHQLEVQDLIKAGINPILTATGGGGAQTGTPSILPRNYGDLGASAMLEGKSTAKQLKLLDAQIDQTKQMNEQTKATTQSEQAKALMSSIEAERTKRNFEAVDESEAGKMLMPAGRDKAMPDWMKAILSSISAMSSAINNHAPSSAKEAMKKNIPLISPLQNVFNPSSAKAIEKPKKKPQTNRERIGSAYDKAIEVYKKGR